MGCCLWTKRNHDTIAASATILLKVDCMHRRRIKLNTKQSTKRLVMLALFVALEIIASRFLSVEFIDKKFSFTFIVTATMGALFGPWFAALAGVVSDIIGNGLFGKFGFFPGFTLTAAVTGFIYGYFLHKDDLKIKDIVIASVLVTLIPNALMNTLWVSIMTKNPFIVKLISRVPLQVMNLVIKLIVLPLLLPRILPTLKGEMKRLGLDI